MLLLKVIKPLCVVEDCSWRSQRLIIALVALIPIIQDYLSKQLGVWVLSPAYSASVVSTPNGDQLSGFIIGNSFSMARRLLSINSGNLNF